MTRDSVEIRNIGISRAIAEDYDRRGVFPDLSPAKALRTGSGRGQSIHAVNRVVACAVVDDAVSRYLDRDRDKPRGLSQAYSCFIDQLSRAFGWPPDAVWSSTRAPSNAEMEEVRADVDAMLTNLGIPPAEKSAHT